MWDTTWRVSQNEQWSHESCVTEWVMKSWVVVTEWEIKSWVVCHWVKWVMSHVSLSKWVVSAVCPYCTGQSSQYHMSHDSFTNHPATRDLWLVYSLNESWVVCQSHESSVAYCTGQSSQKCGTCEWITSHIWLSPIAHINESCCAYKWVVLRVQMSHELCVTQSILPWPK